jgi:Cu+-exporting ATPase
MMKNYYLPVEGMTCASCVTRIEKIISKFEGVKNVSVNLATEHVTFEVENNNFNLIPVAEAVEEYGYKLKLESDNKTNLKNIDDNSIVIDKDDYYEQVKKDFRFSVTLTIPVFVISMLMGFSFFQYIWPLSTDSTCKILFILTTPIIFIGGKRFYKAFWTNLKHFSADMNSLVAIGSGAAYGYSVAAVLFPEIISAHNGHPHVYFETASVIITLILMGKLLEHNAKRKTNTAIKKLIELKPIETIIIENGLEKKIPISDLQLGNVVVIKPGEKIPADGTVIWGNSAVDESMITGESIPVDISSGSKVIGGTINLNGAFNFRVFEAGDNTILAQIIRSVEKALATKPPIQKLVDKIAGIFVPIVILTAIITFITWCIIGGNNSFGNALINFVAVLIIACPCALGLATPTAIIVGTGLGAKHGILIRNGESLELARNVSTIIFDKTGTLTEGKPFVSDIIAMKSSEEELLKLSASLESKSEHPLAIAIIEKAKDKNIALLQPENFQSLSGFGLTGVVNGKTVIIGNINLMKEYSIKITDANLQLEKFAESGKTIVCVAVNRILMGIIVIKDKLRDSAIDAIRKLNSMNIQTVMITGDNFKTAEAIAKEAGINEFKAEILPEGKAEIVKKYQLQNRIVAMVGDGINDSPALAQADIGIAIGTGTDIAIETAQITIVQGNLLNVSKAINLSRNTIRIIKQNLFWAFIYNIIGIPLAALGLLNPMIGALAMSLSSVSVVGNSLRLKKSRL